MEETKPSGHVDSAGGNGSENGADGASDELNRLRNHNKSLLGEKKKLQELKEQYEARIQAEEQEKLQTQGKLKEYADSLKKQLEEQTKKNTQTHKIYSEKFIKQQFNREAEKLGCVSAEDAYKLANLSGIEINDAFEFDSEGLNSALGELQKSKPYLFKKEVSGPKGVLPKQPNGGGGEFDLRTASTDELLAMLKAKNQNQ